MHQRRHAVLLLVVGLLALLYVDDLAMAAKPYTVEGVGVVVRNNQAVARSRAMEGAFRQAVVQAVQELIGSKTMAESRQFIQQELYGWPWPYIHSYRVLWEYPDTPHYRVGIEAAVSLKKVREKLLELGFAPQYLETEEDGGGGLLIFVAERHIGQSALQWRGKRGVVTQALRKKLRRGGIRVGQLEPSMQWDREDGTALAAARRVEAPVVLVGWAGVEQMYSAGSGTAVLATIEVRALDAATEGTVALERVERTVLHDDVGLAGKQALEEAAAELAERLVLSLQFYQ